MPNITLSLFADRRTVLMTFAMYFLYVLKMATNILTLSLD